MRTSDWFWAGCFTLGLIFLAAVAVDCATSKKVYVYSGIVLEKSHVNSTTSTGVGVASAESLECVQSLS